MSAPVSHAETRRALAHQQATELALFEVLGRAVQRTVEPELKLLLATHSRRHGEHWRALGCLLPAGEPPAPPVILQAPILAVYQTVLPEVVAAYQDLLSSLYPLAGAPVRRVVESIVADHRHQQADGLRLISAVGSKEGTRGAGVEPVRTW